MPQKNVAKSEPEAPPVVAADLEESPVLDQAPMDEASPEDTRAYLKGLLEALLYVSDHPLTMKELARAAKIDKKRTEELVGELRKEHEDRGILIEEVAGGFILRSNPRFAGQVRNFLSQRPVRLSRAQLETLAIIAYRQPITRPEIDDIRGVDSGPVLKGLLERELVKILGKKDEPGRPMLYGTTPQFLELFSMQSLRDLPTLKEFTELSDESRRAFEREIGEDAPEGPIELEASEEAPASGVADEQAAGAAEQPPPEEEDPDQDADDDEDDDDDDDDEDDEDDDDDDDDDDDA